MRSLLLACRGWAALAPGPAVVLLPRAVSAQGLAVGDTVLAIDGRPAGIESWNGGLWRWSSEPAGTVVTLTMAGGREVRLTLRDLF